MIYVTHRGKMRQIHDLSWKTCMYGTAWKTMYRWEDTNKMDLKETVC